MNREKLLLLADLLDADADDPAGMVFDLCVVTQPTRERQPAMPAQRNCGTAGCAIGLACLSPEFPELSAYSRGMVYMDGDTETWGVAAQKVFDISHAMAEYLFGPDAYKKTRGAEAEKMVAARIREVVLTRSHGSKESR